jgi:hypothetical protein
MSLLQRFVLAQTKVTPWLFGLGKDQPAPSVESCAAGVTSCLVFIFNWAFKILIYVGGGLAVIMFIMAGIAFITGGANPETVKKARGYLIWVAVGLIVALVSYGLVQLLEYMISSGNFGWLPKVLGIKTAQAQDLNSEKQGSYYSYDPYSNSYSDPNYDPYSDPNYDPYSDPNYDPNSDPNYDPNYDPYSQQQSSSSRQQSSGFQKQSSGSQQQSSGSQSNILNFEPKGIKCGGSGNNFITIFNGGGGITTDVSEDIWKSCLLWFIEKVLRVVYTVTLLVSVGFIIFTGFQYVQSGGNVKDIHGRLIWIIVGVSVTILAYAIVKAIELSLTQR